MSIRIRLLLLVFAVWLPAAAGFGMLARSIYLQQTLAGREHVQAFARTLNLLVERELDRRATMARTLAASTTLRRGDLHAFYDEAAAATRGGDGWVLLVTPTVEVVDTHRPWQEGLALPRPAGAPMVRTEPPDVFFAARGTAARGPVLGLFLPESGTAPPRYDVGVAFEPATIQSLVDQQAAPDASLVSVMDDEQLVLIEGAIPGAKQGSVTVRGAAKAPKSAAAN